MNRINKQMVDSTLTEKEVDKIAEETAKALGSKFSVTKDSVDNRSFSLDYDGVKYDGGSYLIMYNGDIVNVAIMKAPIYYNYKTKKKYEFGGDFQAGVYAGGGRVGLIGNQKRIDMNKNGRIDAEDFKILRSTMNGAWRNEQKHVNKEEDYEVRYAKTRPARKGYKGKRNFDDGGTIDAFTIRVVKGVSGKPNEVISDPQEIKFKEGGGVEYVAVSQKISKKDKADFLEYINEFYGKKGIYADDLNGGFSKPELTKAINTYLKQLDSTPTWGYGDSVDRERVRQILQPSYKIFDEGGFMSYGKEKMETSFTNKDGIRVRSKVEPKEKISEKEWMAKHNSSKEARSYIAGGSIRDIKWANADNKKLGVWLLTSVDGNAILNKSKNATELEKNVMDYYKKRGSVARMTWDDDADDGLSWVTFTDLYNEIKSYYMAGGKTETSTKKGKGNHKMKAVTDYAKKIRKDGEKWTDALRRAYQEMK